jgi:hypothetical protein
MAYDVVITKQIVLILLALGNYALGWALARVFYGGEKGFGLSILIGILSGAALGALGWFVKFEYALYAFAFFLIFFGVVKLRFGRSAQVSGVIEEEEKERKLAREVIGKAKEKMISEPEGNVYSRVLGKLQSLGQKEKEEALTKALLGGGASQEIEEQVRQHLHRFREEKGRYPEKQELERLTNEIFRQMPMDSSQEIKFRERRRGLREQAQKQTEEPEWPSLKEAFQKASAKQEIEEEEEELPSLEEKEGSEDELLSFEDNEELPGLEELDEEAEKKKKKKI